MTTRIEQYQALTREIGNRVRYRLTSADSDVVAVSEARRALNRHPYTRGWWTPEALEGMRNPKPDALAARVPGAVEMALWERLFYLATHPLKRDVEMMLGMPAAELKRRLDAIGPWDPNPT